MVSLLDLLLVTSALGVAFCHLLMWPLTVGVPW